MGIRRMKIKAALSNSPEAPFELAEVELDEPRADEVLVELTAVGVCHTDLTMKAVWPQAMSPIVLGHDVLDRRRGVALALERGQRALDQEPPREPLLLVAERQASAVFAVIMSHR